MNENKEQITIRVRNETAEALREESRKIGGSNQYMGQVVDDLVAENDMDNTEILKKLNEIDEKIGTQTTPSTASTHTTQSNISEGLEEKIENEEPIDTDEFDLSQLKGTSKVMDVAMLVAKNETILFREDIDELFQSEFDYSINSAREKRKKLMTELKEIPPEMDIDGWVDEEIDSEWHLVAKTGNKWLSAHRNVNDKEAWFKDQYGGSLENYLTEKVDMDFRPRYTHPEKYEQGLTIYRSMLEHYRDYVDDDKIEIRLSRVTGEIQNELNEIEN